MSAYQPNPGAVGGRPPPPTMYQMPQAGGQQPGPGPLAPPPGVGAPAPQAGSRLSRKARPVDPSALGPSGGASPQPPQAQQDPAAYQPQPQVNMYSQQPYYPESQQSQQQQQEQQPQFYSSDQQQQYDQYGQQYQQQGYYNYEQQQQDPNAYSYGQQQYQQDYYGQQQQPGGYEQQQQQYAENNNAGQQQHYQDGAYDQQQQYQNAYGQWDGQEQQHQQQMVDGQAGNVVPQKDQLEQQMVEPTAPPMEEPEIGRQRQESEGAVVNGHDPPVEEAVAAAEQHQHHQQQLQQHHHQVDGGEEQQVEDAAQPPPPAQQHHQQQVNNNLPDVAPPAGRRPPDILLDDPFIPSSDRNLYMQTGQLQGQVPPPPVAAAVPQAPPSLEAVEAVEDQYQDHHAHPDPVLDNDNYSERERAPVDGGNDSDQAPAGALVAPLQVNPAPVDDVDIPLDRLVLGESSSQQQQQQPVAPPLQPPPPAGDRYIAGGSAAAPAALPMPVKPTATSTPTRQSQAEEDNSADDEDSAAAVAAATSEPPPPPEQRSEAAGSDRREAANVMAPPPPPPTSQVPSGPRPPSGQRNVTGSASASGTNPPAFPNGPKQQQQQQQSGNNDAPAGLDDDSVNSRDSSSKLAGRGDRRHHRREHGGRDYRRRRRSRSRSSSEERDSSEERYQARRASHRANRSRRDDYSPPYHSSSKKDDRYRYRDHRDPYYRDRDRRYYDEDARKERSFRDDRSYYDDRRSESGRKPSGRYDHDRSYNYKDQGSSRPSSRAGSVYEERYYDRDRYDRDRYDRDRYDYVMRHAGYPSMPYGVHPSYHQPQPASMPPPADPAVLDNFQKHWQHYLSHPDQFHKLQASNPDQFANLNNYYRMYGEYLRLQPIPPPGVVVKQEPADSFSGEPQDERTASRASGQSSEAAAATGAANIGASAVDSGLPTETKLEQEASTICTDPNADPRYQPTFMQDQDAIQEYDEDVPAPTGRMTPAKFSGPQVRAVFGPRGQMAKVDAHAPSLGQSATVELHSLQLTLESQSKELAAFPGPLVPGRTHKGEVIQFCQAKAAAARADGSVPDRDSLVLIWELLVLLLRQKNAVDGSDIAELLLKDRKDSDLGGGRGGRLGSCASESVISDAITESAVVFDRSAINHSAASDHERVTAKFRDYLVYGHKKEGLEYAMRHGLWGHALFLASKMDERSYSNVMLRFANGLAANDPLQTLYQLMSGRQPVAVKECADGSWGDWRPHLAMILSNPSGKEMLDHRSILTLGDTLRDKGFLHAAHFCYLMASVEFGAFSNRTAKLVLIGADHAENRSADTLDAFATNEALQCTEIFEYVQRLSNPDLAMMPFQYLKFRYAIRLLDAGMASASLHYLEQIAKCLVAARPQDIHPDLLESKREFAERLYCLAERLKYLDPMYAAREGEIGEMGDPEWLTQLRQLIDSGSLDQEGETAGGGAATEYQYYQGEDGQYYQYDPNYYQQQTQEEQQQQQQQQHEEEQPRDASSPVQHHSSESQFSPPATHESRQEPQFEGTEPIMMKPIPEESPQPELHPQVPMFVPASSGGGDSSAASTPRDPNLSPPPPPMMVPNNVPASNVTPPTPPTTAGGGQNYFSSVGKRKQAAAPPPQPQKVDNDNKKEAKAKSEKNNNNNSSNSGPGMFGRLLGRFIKQPNQMHLPEDQDQSIVWDEDKKRWVNRDADEDEDQTGAAAPPSDLELSRTNSTADMGLQQQPTLPTPLNHNNNNNVLAPPGGPPGGGNKFAGRLGKRRGAARGAGRVDVFKNSQSAPVLNAAMGAGADGQPPMMPPPMMMPPTSGMVPNMMMPAPLPEESGSAADSGGDAPQEQQHDQQQQQPPQQMMFFNPGDFAAK